MESSSPDLNNDFLLTRKGSDDSFLYLTFFHAVINDYEHNGIFHLKSNSNVSWRSNYKP